LLTRPTTQMLDANRPCHLDRDSTGMLSRCSAYFVSRTFGTVRRQHRSEHGFREEALHMTTDYDSVDYFTDQSLVPDPHPYFDHLRTKNPVCCPIDNGVLAVTGWEAANAVYKDT